MKVLNKKNDSVEVRQATYIGRPTKWGNPFFMKTEAERNTVCDKYVLYILDINSKELREEARRELKGKDLACFCAPKRCHGDILMDVANSSSDKELFEKYKDIYNDANNWRVKDPAQWPSGIPVVIGARKG